MTTQQLTHHPVVLVTGSQNNHPLIEGQYIIYTCPPGFVLIGPNALVCTRSGEWEPDPGEVDYVGNNYTQRYRNNATLLYRQKYLHINHFLSPQYFAHAADCGVPL